ncbi:MAG: helix-turn-helix domain-containing protein [Saprospiraceae bacterium]|nr:helix-turn-helix domain-containing protein [Saprospiraceae bacterium]
MKSLKKIINYGLYGETDKRFVPDFVHFELLKTRSAVNNWEIKPHIHTQLFQLSFIESSTEASVHFEGETTVLTPPCLVYVPQNTVHGFDFTPDAQGCVIVAGVSFIEYMFRESPNILFELSKPQVLFLGNDNAPIHSIIDKIRLEMLEELPERTTALRTYFSFLLMEIFRLSNRQNTVSTSNNRNLTHFRNFQRHIQQSNSLKKTISEYAKELTITPVHLNRICQSVAGKTASQIVQEHLISEAERYLKQSDFSVSEIAYLLNFENLSYFTRMFKKHVGVSPKDFKTVSKERAKNKL